MARASRRLVDALRMTADRLEQGATYEWGHMGRCNCGHLAQTLTPHTPEEIHRMAMRRIGDWTEQTREYCPSSGFEMDALVNMMLEVGLTRIDLEHLEKLSDPTIVGARNLRHNVREDVIVYMREWADQLAAGV